MEGDAIHGKGETAVRSLERQHNAIWGRRGKARAGLRPWRNRRASGTRFMTLEFLADIDGPSALPDHYQNHQQKYYRIRRRRRV